MSDIKKIKKNLYGKPQIIHAVFPAGMGKAALAETQDILNHLWFKQKYTSEFSVTKNIIHIQPIHLFAVTELLMRSQSLSDIRLVIFEGNASSREIFRKKCEAVHWDFYLNKNILLKIKVNSVASRAFHETGLKEILSGILQDHVAEMVSGENTDETTTLYVDLYKNKLTISLSLAGQPLYKRGYRHVLSNSAPLREDAAFCCLNNALQYSKEIDEAYFPEAVYIPFSGTGTFAFEYMQSYYGFSPALFERHYAIEKMSFFNKEHFNFILKKAKENIRKPDHDICFVCVDHSESAVSSMLENVKNVENAFLSHGVVFSTDMFQNKKDDFFKMDLERMVSGKNIFMPLNPPYGIRIGKNIQSAELYRKIAIRINEVMGVTQQSGKKLLGFILCPDEKTWSSFCNTVKNVKMQSYHFTQGGLDIRVCQFFA